MHDVMMLRANRRRHGRKGSDSQQIRRHHLWEWQLLLREWHLRWYLLYTEARVFPGRGVDRATKSDLIAESTYSVHLFIHHFPHPFHLYHWRRSHRVFIQLSFGNCFDHSYVFDITSSIFGKQGSPCNRNDSWRSCRRFCGRYHASYGRLHLETSQSSNTAKSSKQNAAFAPDLESWLAVWTSSWGDCSNTIRALRRKRNSGN